MMLLMFAFDYTDENNFVTKPFLFYLKEYIFLFIWLSIYYIYNIYIIYNLNLTIKERREKKEKKCVNNCIFL